MLPEPDPGVTSRVWGDNRRVWDTVNRPQTLPRRNGDLCEAPCGAPLDLVCSLFLLNVVCDCEFVLDFLVTWVVGFLH